MPRPIRLLIVIGFILAGCRKEQPAVATSQPTASTSQLATSTELRIAAAADLQFALAEVSKSFEQSHPGCHLAITYGASGNFFSQLSNKAPFDLFLSADATYPQKLSEQNLSASAPFHYATGHIVLWAPKTSSVDGSKGFKSLTDSAAKKIAVANPDHAPYGRAAVAALKAAGVYDQIKDRIVLGENIAQTAQFASSGAADVGVIALSLALAPKM